MKEPETFDKAIYCTHAVFVGVYVTVAAVLYSLVGDNAAEKINDQLPHQGKDSQLRAIINAMLFIHAVAALAINSCVVNTALVEHIRCSKWRLCSSWCCYTDTKVPSATAIVQVRSPRHPGARATDGTRLAVSSTPSTESASVPASGIIQLQQVKGEEEHKQLLEETTRNDHPRSIWMCTSVMSLAVFFVISQSMPSFTGLLAIIAATLGIMTAYSLPIFFTLLLLADYSDTGKNVRERLVLKLLLGIAMIMTVIFSYVSVANFIAQWGLPGGNRPWHC
jgi:hypothetical protein